MFHGLEFIKAYINDLLIITKGNWSNHLEKLELTQTNIKENRIKCNIEESLLGQTETEYLDFWVAWIGI